MVYRVGIIGCGRPRSAEGATGFGMSHAHAWGCKQSPDAQLSFNHQRRFATAFRTARDLVQEGVIGDLERIEGVCDNLFDWGTHWFDMIHFFNGETPAEWAIGQIEGRGSKQIFGAWMEGQGLSHIRFQNGVHAF